MWFSAILRVVAQLQTLLTRLVHSTVQNKTVFRLVIRWQDVSPILPSYDCHQKTWPCAQRIPRARLSRIAYSGFFSAVKLTVPRHGTDGTSRTNSHTTPLYIQLMGCEYSKIMSNIQCVPLWCHHKAIFCHPIPFHAKHTIHRRISFL